MNRPETGLFRQADDQGVLTRARARKEVLRIHSGALVQTAEVKVVHQGAELVFGLNATPDKTRHSVTVRRGQDSGPDVIHIQTNGVYHGVVDEVVETRGRLTCVRVRYACIGVATFTGGVVSPGAPLVDRGLRRGLCRIAPRQSD